MPTYLRIQNDSGNTSLTGAWVNFAPVSEVFVRVTARFIDCGAPVAFELHRTPGSGGVGPEPEEKALLIFGPDGTIPDFFISGASSIFVDTGYFEGGTFIDDALFTYDFHGTYTGVTVPLAGGRTGYEWDAELRIDGVVVATGTLVMVNIPGTGFQVEDDVASLYFTMWGDAPAGTMLIGSIRVGTTGFGSDDLVPVIDFDDGATLPDLDGFNAEGDGVIDLFTIADPEPPGERFAESGPWRYVFTTLETETVSFYDKLVSDRQIVRTLNAPLVLSGRAPSDSPLVNLVMDDGYPIIAEGVRLVYAFRNEGGTDTWTIRAAGVCLDVRDSGGPTDVETIFQAWDPWEFAKRKPIVDNDGTLPTEDGLRPGTVAGNLLVVQLISDAVDAHGTIFLDYGQTSQYAGTIETTDDITEVFQQGMSLAEALDQIVATGTLDIVLDPIYDPLNRPGIIAELNVYATAGTTRYDSSFGWDKFPRSVVRLDRETDGRERANRIQFYAGQGGPAVPLQSNLASSAIFGEYWMQQFFPGIDEAGPVEAMAALQLRLRKLGLVTYALSPAPERAPVPFSGYDIGDYVPVYNSDRLREASYTLKRVYSIPLVIGNDQMEAPSNVVVADDETTT